MCVNPANMVQLWGFTLLLLASLCVVHTKPYEEEKHRALQRTGYVYVEGVGYYRLVRHEQEHRDYFIWQLLLGTSSRYFGVRGGDPVSELL